MDQFKIYRDELVVQVSKLEQAIDDACRSVPELAMPAERAHRLVVRVREAREEMIKVQLELDLQITELKLKVQSSTPLEVREKCTHAIQIGFEKIGQVTEGCTEMLQQALTILTHLQEDPSLQ